jgi:hypothetical protein
MNKSLSTFMKLALTATVIAALLWNKMYALMVDIANTVASKM